MKITDTCACHLLVDVDDANHELIIDTLETGGVREIAALMSAMQCSGDGDTEAGALVWTDLLRFVRLHKWTYGEEVEHLAEMITHSVADERDHIQPAAGNRTIANLLVSQRVPCGAAA